MGSPIAETGIVAPSFAAVQPASVMTLFSASAGKRDPGARIVEPDIRPAGAWVCGWLQAAVSKKQNRYTASNTIDFLILSFIVIAPVFDALVLSA